MKKLMVASLATLAVFAMAVTSAEMNKRTNCTQVSVGARGGYFTKKIYTCEVDVNRLMLRDPGGNINSAPAGTYQVGPNKKPLNVGVGGYILR